VIRGRSAAPAARSIIVGGACLLRSCRERAGPAVSTWRTTPGGSGQYRHPRWAAKAPADGYTILAISSTLVVNPSLFNKASVSIRRATFSAGVVGRSVRRRFSW